MTGMCISGKGTCYKPLSDTYEGFGTRGNAKPFNPRCHNRTGRNVLGTDPEVTPPDSPDFRPLMTLYCSDQLEIDDLSHGYSEGIKAVKYYPAGATTNSQSGGSAMMNYNLF